MDLKELLGEELYNQVTEKAGDNKLAVVSDGSYIPKEKFNEKLTEKNNRIEELEGVLSENEQTITQLKDQAPKEETPEQQQIRELREEIEQNKREAQREKLMSKAVSYASEKGLPTDLVSYFIGEDEDSTMTNLSQLEERYNGAIQQGVEARFKQGGRNPQDNPQFDQSVGAQFAQQANQQKEAPNTNIWE